MGCPQEDTIGPFGGDFRLFSCNELSIFRQQLQLRLLSVWIFWDAVYWAYRLALRFIKMPYTLGA